MKFYTQLSIALSILSYFCILESSVKYDLTVVSQIKFADGVHRLGIGFIDALKDDLTINHISTQGNYDLTDLNDRVKEIILNPDKTPGKVALFCDFLWTKGSTPSSVVPRCPIKIAYSMFEFSAIPSRWVDILNNEFDLVAVPDESSEVLYKQSGVKIPIFVLPHGIYVEDMLNLLPKTPPTNIFNFGLSAGFWERKNHERLIDAFHAEFGDNPHIKLKLHGRTADAVVMEGIQKKIRKLRATNIEIIKKVFTAAEYTEFISELHCIVVLSRGEGFSIAPREALALGCPCILSNNTAHKTLCKTGLFKCVCAEIPHKDVLGVFDNLQVYDWDCDVAEVRQALRDVYTHYDTYLKKAEEGRNWVKKYLWPNVKAKILNLIKPTQVLLGEQNSVTDEYLMTNSPELYKKYKEL